MNTAERKDKKRDGTKYATASLEHVDESSHYGRLLKAVGHNKRVLELGCSTGFLSESMTDLQKCQVTGIEIDPECVEVARTKCNQVICADLDNCDLQKVLPEERFDVILCADVLEHLRDPSRLLRSLRRWLVDDGYVVASIPNIAHGSVRLSLLEGRFPYRPMGLLDETHIKFFNRALIEELFESAGYMVTVIGRNRWSVMDTEVGDRLAEASARQNLPLIEDDPEAETYQFIVKATKYSARDAAGTRQKMLALSSGATSSHDPIDKEPLPAVDCVIFETSNASVCDRYSAHFKNMNYPENLLHFSIIDAGGNALTSQSCLNDTPPSFSRLSFRNFRFVGAGMTDPNCRQVFLTKTEPSSQARPVSPLKLQESLNAGLVFLCDASMYPSAQCLLKLAREHQSHPDCVILATAEIRLAPRGQSNQTGSTEGEYGPAPMLVPGHLLQRALKSLPLSQKLSMESILSSLEKTGAKIRRSDQSMFFFMGTSGSGTTSSSPSGRESAEPSTSAALSSPGDNRCLYLDLMEKCLLNLIYEDPFTDWQDRTTAQSFDPVKRQLGRDWPMVAHTMIGELRMRNLRTLIESILEQNIPGDLIETGVWRGGACIYMRAILKSYGIEDRRVFVADSFEGLPPPNPEMYPADTGDRHHEFNELAISLEQVQSNFAKYGLLDDQVVFLKGWFKDTLPDAPIERLSLLRLDGDMYESTMDGLNNLYDKVSPGGFVIADDYGLVHNCKRAIEDFRTARGITSPLIDIDGCGVYWQKGLAEGSSKATATGEHKPESVAPEPTSPCSYAALLPPVAQGARPFFSVIVPICNRLDYLGKCLDSILDQDPGEENLEIIVQDDSSDMDIKAAVDKLGRGRVRYNTTRSRLGLYGNTNDGLVQARGHWIHVLHDDDFVLPGFYETMRSAVENLPETVGVACCRYTTLYEGTNDTFTAPQLSDKAGILENWLATIARENMLNIPAIVIKRAVFEKIGVFADDLNYAGDWEFWIRSAMHYQWWYQPENLARFIVHEKRKSLTGVMSDSGEAFANIRITLDRVSEFLPQTIVESTISPARITFSKQFLGWSKEQFEKGNKELGIKIAIEAATINKKCASTPEFFALLSQDPTGQLRRLAAASWEHRAKEKTDPGITK